MPCSSTRCPGRPPYVLFPFKASLPLMGSRSCCANSPSGPHPRPKSSRPSSVITSPPAQGSAHTRRDRLSGEGRRVPSAYPQDPNAAQVCVRADAGPPRGSHACGLVRGPFARPQPYKAHPVSTLSYAPLQPTAKGVLHTGKAQQPPPRGMGGRKGSCGCTARLTGAHLEWAALWFGGRRPGQDSTVYTVIASWLASRGWGGSVCAICCGS